MNNRRTFSGLFAIAWAVLVQSPAVAQSYAHVTIVDGQTAKAVALATEQAFNGRIPDVPNLEATTVRVDEPGSNYVVNVSSNVFGKLKSSLFNVDARSSKVAPAAAGSNNPSLSLPGIYAAALVLSTPAFEASRSPLVPKGDINVQINRPYDKQPNTVFVAYLPKPSDIEHATPSGSIVTIGCGPGIGFSINISKHTVTPLKAVC